MASVETVNGPGCGVDAHPEECLCDVIVSQETPIRYDPVRDMWMGRELVEHNGYNRNGWDDDTILEYLGDLVHLHDMFIAQKATGEADRRISPKGTTILHPLHILRRNARRLLANPDAPPIRQILESLGVTAERFTEAVSMGYWSLTMEQLETFEQNILTTNKRLGELSKEAGISTDSASRLRTYWGNRTQVPVHQTSGTHPYQIRMRELINENMKPSLVVQAIKKEYGVTITRNAVGQARKRMRDKHEPTLG